jgi:sugar phosphate isomerase/epimerase
MASRIAAQMYTVRDFTRRAKDLQDTIEKLGKIGYRAVQLSAVGAIDGESPDVGAKEVRAMLDDHGMRCVATHRAWEALATNVSAEIDFHQALGCDYVALGMMPRDYLVEREKGYARFVRDAAPVIAQLKRAGIRFGYHNHDWEFQRSSPGKTLYDILIEQGGSDFTLEIDVYWADHAGVNPVRLFERCAGRVPVIHIKDKEVIEGEGPVMAPIGEGNLDWDGLLPAFSKAGVEWICVEQDTCRRDPFDCLKSSYDFLTARGV